MAARLAVRNKKLSISQERELFSEIAKLKTFRVQQRPVCILSHERRTLALTSLKPRPLPPQHHQQPFLRVLVMQYIPYPVLRREWSGFETRR